jgi:hypothetical protein
VPDPRSSHSTPRSTPTRPTGRATRSRRFRTVTINLSRGQYDYLEQQAVAKLTSISALLRELLLQNLPPEPEREAHAARPAPAADSKPARTAGLPSTRPRRSTPARTASSKPAPLTAGSKTARTQGSTPALDADSKPAQVVDADATPAVDAEARRAG